MKTLRQILTAAFFTSLPAVAQVPYSLKHTIAAPFGTAQTYAQLGYSVAVDGGYAVVGAPYDDTGASDAGVVKVFDTNTGTLLLVLRNPAPATGDNFGIAVAVSGTRVAVGAPNNNYLTNNSGSVYVYDLSTATPSVPIVTLNNPGNAADDFFGISVALSGMVLVAGASHDGSAGSNSGSAYVYDLNRLSPPLPVTTLKNPSPGLDERFGHSVAVDGTRVVVGAYWDDAGAESAGSAFVYDLASGTPAVPVATLNNPDPAPNDYFGCSVSISGTFAVVGACQDDMGAKDAGTAYVYDLNSGGTTPVATLTNPDPDPLDDFGYSVSISGTRVVVGAIYGSVGAYGAGSAYVYDLNNGTPAKPVATLYNPSPKQTDCFGRCVAIAGTRIVAGASSDNTGAEGAGSAYIYDLSGGTPALPAVTLNDPVPSAHDNFGHSVAISGARMVVGAPGDSADAPGTGRAYVYDLSSAAPSVPVTTLINACPDGSAFGTSVAISGALVAVGSGGNSAGCVYVYDLSRAVPSVPIISLANPGLPGADNFGTPVAISGTKVVVGYSWYYAGSADAGTVYVYDLQRGTPTDPAVTLNHPTGATGDFFGNAVAIDGSRVVVGAFGDDTGANDAGSAFVYDLDSATPAVPILTLANPVPAAGRFGYALAISGTRVAVWAPEAGSTYVYDLASAIPALPVVTLNSPGPSWRGIPGNSVSISGTRVAVGDCYGDTVTANGGSAYIYDLSSGTPTVPVATLHKAEPANFDLFGFSVAIDGTTVAIGTPFDDGVMTDKGYVYVYDAIPSPLDPDNDGLLDSWELTYWPTTAGHRSLDDFDHDGYVELLELAFGLNPVLPDPGGLPPVTIDGGYLTITIAKHPGVTYEVQSAGTLLPGKPNSFKAATTTVLVDDAATLIVRDNIPIGALPRRFLRVKVTAAP